MTSSTIDHVTKGFARIALQYRNSPRFKAWLQTWLEQSNELEAAIQEVALVNGIDEAYGYSLDVIGAIVGIDRVLEGVLPLDVFGFDDRPGSLPMGEEGVPGVGGRFFDEFIEEPFGSSVMDDATYRAAIRLKIARNTSHGTREDMLVAVNAVMQQIAGVDVPCYVNDTQNMSATILIGKILTLREKALLTKFDFLPKPIGVQLFFLHFDRENYFGFEGQPGARGFAEEGIPNTGAPFAQEFS